VPLSYFQSMKLRKIADHLAITLDAESGGYKDLWNLRPSSADGYDEEYDNPRQVAPIAP